MSEYGYKITDLANSCRNVEYTLWLEHIENYNYINAYNLAYLSRLAYSRVVLEDSNVSSIVNFNFQQFIEKAQNPFVVCHMDGNWDKVKMTQINDEGKESITTGLTPFITLVDIGKGIQYPSPETGYVNDEKTSTAALFYCDDKRAVIAVRGTHEFWHDGVIIDGDAEQIKPDSDFNIKGEFHKGFYIQARAIINADLFKIFFSQIKGKELYLTGHSLGGAVATILAAYLYEKGLKPLLYTYGSPRVGNVHFANYYANRFTHFRHVNGGDIVPAVPGRILDGNIKTLAGQTLKNAILPSFLEDPYNGLINIKGDVYTHHGTLCQFINENNRVLMLPFFQHEITQLSASIQTVEEAKSRSDRAHKIGDLRAHSIDAYLDNVKAVLIELYGFYTDNHCMGTTPESCQEHPLNSFLKKRINAVQKEIDTLSKTPNKLLMITMMVISPKIYNQYYKLIVDREQVKKTYQNILAKLEKLDKTTINQYELYSKHIGHPDVEKQLKDLIGKV
ncbi:lipase family protein [Aggregatibacter actinomycetemcomitans]|uniref:lipase family protein n=1 Tax=Aggregatibacter actinomycetemcomitans TaxID=714 RepID=UPI00197B71D9|nr:lipase family protein [Aggregatibacter actinomycetemcomitans]MBN6062870.1 lipase family protein [Aggregatibacter actinomycetemcomitans]MBN6082068.1 lipase family protein [Aggregatibacter actinomycetemcomitans]MBN6082818.1 lipase family protein [Aggregatibacter actinomycetemcomitans]